jgi:hypothetical protein
LMDRTNLIIGLALGAVALAWRLRALARLPRTIRAQRRLARMRRRREGVEMMDLATSVRSNGLACPHCGERRPQGDREPVSRILEWTEYALICELSCGQCPGRWRVLLFAMTVDLPPKRG